MTIQQHSTNNFAFILTFGIYYDHHQVFVKIMFQ